MSPLSRADGVGVLSLAFLWIFGAIPVRAGVYSNNLANSLWSGGTTWVGNFTNGAPGPVTNDASTIIRFTTTAAASSTTNDYSSVVLNQLISATTTRALTLYGSGQLVFTNNGGNLPAVSNASSGLMTINEALNATTTTMFRTLTTGGITVNSNITGNGALVISNTGAGIVTLTGSNSFSGGITIAAGTLKSSNGLGFALGPGAVVNNSLLQFYTSTTMTNQSGLISGTGLVEYASGVSTLYMVSSNAYTGGTLISGSGRVALGSDSALGTGAITFTAAAGNISSTGGATRTLGNVLVFSNNATLGVGTTDSGLLNLTGRVDLTSSTAMRQLTISSPVILAGVVSNGGFVKLGSGTLILSNANNSYTLGTTNTAGVLALGGDNVLGSGTLFMNGGTLASDGATARTLTNAILMTGNGILGQVAVGTGDLTLSGTVDLGAGTRTLAVSNNLVTISGVLTNMGGFVKAGPGNLALLNSNAFLGPLGVIGGQVILANPWAAVNATVSNGVPGGVVFSNASAFTFGGLTGTTNLNLVNTDGGAVVLTVGGNSSNTTFSGALGGSGSLVKVGTGTLQLFTSSNTFGGGVTIAGGTVAINNTNSLGTGLLTFSGGGLSNILNKSVANDMNLVSNATISVINAEVLNVNGVLTNSGGVVKLGTGSLSLNNGGNSYGGGNTVLGGTLQASSSDGWALGTGAVTVTSGATLVLKASTFSTVLTNVSSLISGAGLVSFGQGIFLMNASNDYSGGTLVAGNGRVALGNDLALGTGTITFNDPNAKLSSTGGATRTLANDVVFTNLSSLGNSTDNGALIFNGGVDLGGGLLNLNLASPVTFSGVVTNGGIAKAGASILTLSGVNTYSGLTIISNGTLQIGSAVAGLNPGAVTVAGGTYDLGGQAGVTNGAIVMASGAISNGSLVGSSYLLAAGNLSASLGGTGFLTKTGTTTTVTLSGANTYGGGTFLTGGVLAVGAANALPSAGALTVAGGTLNLGGFTVTNGAFTATAPGIPLSNGTLVASSFLFSNGGTVTNFANLAGSGALTKSGGGNLLFNQYATNTYSGGTVINSGGTLIISNNNLALGSGTVTFNDATLQGGFGGVTLANNIQFMGLTNTFNVGYRWAFMGSITINTNSVLDISTASIAETVTLGGPVGELVPGSSLTLSGSRTAVLATNNTYTGATIINNAGGTTILGSNATSSVLLNPGKTLIIGNNFALGTGFFTAANATIGATNSPVVAAVAVMQGTNTFSPNSSRLTFANAVNMSSNLVLNAQQSGGDSYAVTFGGGFTDNGSNFSLAFIGNQNRVFVLSNASSYTGGTIIDNIGGNVSAIVTLAADNGLATNSSLRVDAVNPAGSLNLNGYNQTVLALSGTGTVVLGTGTLTMGDSSVSTFGGTIWGAGNFVKQGAGTLVLASSNAFTGFTTLNGGTLLVSNQNALSGSTLNYTNGVVVGSGITSVMLGGLVSGQDIGLTNADGTAITLTVGNNGGLSTVNGALSQGGALTKAGAGTLVLNGNNTYQGGTLVNGGTLVLNGDNSGLTNTFTVGSGSVTNMGNLSPIGLVMGNASGAVGFFTAAGGNIAISSNLILGSAAGGAGTYVIAGGTNLFTPSAGASGTLKLGAAASSTGTLVMVGGVLDTTSNVTLEVGRAGVGILTLSNNAILSAGDITVAANAGSRGTLTMSGTSSLTGALSMNAGTSTVTIAGGTFSESGGASMILGNTASALATLLVRGGLFTNSAGANLTLGNNGGSGNLVVDGGSYLSVGGSVNLGGTAGSRGTLTSTGGFVSIAANTINVGGAAGAVGTVYVGSNGTVNLTANSPASINVGNLAGATGTVTVAGGNLTVGGFPLNIGSGGFGTLNVSNGLMAVNNGLVLGSLASGTGTYNQVGGTLVNTNAAGTATLVVGQAGVGSFMMKGGAAIVDNLIATNNADGYTNSIVVLGGGTLVTRSAYLNPMGSSVNIGTNGLVWNATGINQVLGPASFVNIGSGGANVLNLSGSGTLWTNNGSLRVGISPNGSNQMNITAGAQAFSYGAQIGAANGSNNTVVVAGDGSLWYVSGTNGSDMMVGAQGAGNLLLVSNGGSVYSGGLIMGNLAGSGSNRVVVSGPGSVYNTTGSANIGNSAGSGGQSIVISNGALFVTASASLGQNASAGNNSLWIGGAANGTNAQWITQGSAGDKTYIGYNSPSNQLTVAAGGSVFTPMMTLGVNAGSFGNVVTVNGGSLVVTNVGTPGVGILETQWGTLAINSGSVVVTKLLLATNAGNEGTLNWTGGSLSVGSLGANSNNASAILQSLIGSGLGNVSTQTISYSVNANPVFTSDVGLGLAAGGKGSLNVGAGTLTLTNASLLVGQAGVGALTVTGGTVVAEQVAVGQSVGASGLVSVASGSLVVTNASGTGSLVVGQSGLGALLLSGGSMTVDRLIATNNIMGGATNSIVQLNSGTMNSSPNGSTISVVGNLVIGNGGSVAWNVLGGTNVTTSTGTITLGTNTGGRVVANISGQGTVWSNSATTFFIGNGGQSVVTISNQAHAVTPDTVIGAYITSGSKSDSNIVLVTGNSTIWDTGALTVGQRNNTFNQLFITTGAVVRSTSGTMGGTSVSSFNNVLVDGTGAQWLVSGQLLASSQGLSNTLTVSHGGFLSYGNMNIGHSGGGVDNTVLVTDPGSFLGGGTLLVGRQSSGSTLILSNSAIMVTGEGDVGGASGSSVNNKAVITDAGSRWTVTNANFMVGYAGGGGNSLLVRNGGALVVSNGQGYLGYTPGLTSSVVTVTDPGSRWVMDGDLIIGYQGLNASLLITNGGLVSSANGKVSLSLLAASNNVVISGAGSLWQNSGVVYVGSNLTTKGSAASLLVTDGGILEAVSLVSGWAGTGVISNQGGVFRFTTNTPVITTNTLNSIAVANGIVEFEGVNAANVTGQISRISYTGNNTLRLNAATNSALAWAVSNGMNFSTLELVNDGAMWQGPSLLVADGGTLRASNANATLSAVLTNAGTVSVVNGQLTYLSNVVLNGGLFLTQNGTNNFTRGLGMAAGATLTFTTGTSRVEGAISNAGTINAVNANVTFGGPVVISGLYASDPSTNTFTSNVTVTASGALSGGVGDLFVFQKDLLMQSTNAAQFNLFQSAVLFSNGPNHLLSISNSGALNIGQGFASFAQVATNFAIGQLSIAIGDRLTLAGNKDGLTNALYVGWLDLQGAATNSFDAATNSLFQALNLANVNLYYDTYDVRNAWLNEWLPDTGYDLWGGGLLLPIPEPSTWVGLGGGLALLAFLRRRRS